MYATISNDLMNQIIEDESTTENAWNRLQNIFQDNKNSRALYLQREFNTIRLDDFQNCAAYYQQIKVLADQLRNVGDKVTDDRMVLQLIAGLNDNFDTAGTYFTHLDKLPSFYDARSKLILEETRKQKQVINNHTTTDAALVVTPNPKPASIPDPQQSTDWQTNSNFRYNTNRGRSGRGSNRGRSNRGRGRASPNQSPQWSGYPPWMYSSPQWTNPPNWTTPPCPYPTNNWARPNSSYSSNSNQDGILGPRPSHAHFSNGSVSGYCPTDLDQAMHTMTLNPPDDIWYMDTGATSHMTVNSGNLESYYPLRHHKNIIVGNGHGMPIHGFGKSTLLNTSRPLYLQNILHSPNLIKNLISVRRLSVDNNISLEFDPFGFIVKDFPQGKPVLRCNSTGNLYPNTNSVLRHISTPSTFAAFSQDLWHHRLGHPWYPSNHRGYKCYDMSSKIFIICRNVTFDEHTFPFANVSKSVPSQYQKLTDSINPSFFTYQSAQTQHPISTTSGPPSPSAHFPISHELSPLTPSDPLPTNTAQSPPLSPNSNSPNTSPDNSPPTPPCVSPTSPSDQSHHTPQPTRTVITRGMQGIYKPKVPFNLSTLTSIFHIPRSPKDALSDPNWTMAMTDEYKALIDNNTWVLVPRTPNMHVIRSMWIFRHKIKSDGSLERYKARLVGDGRSQIVGIDCNETFSPVVKPATIRLVLSIAISKSWNINQLDVKNAFLHGSLDETVYMYQPYGFRDPSKSDHVCLLKRSLYRLKQAPRAWYQQFATFASLIGFHNSSSDHSLFIYTNGNDTAYLLLYVDDIILVTSSTKLRTTLMSSFAREFSMKDLGDLNYFLGISVTRNTHGLFLSQEKYAEDIIIRAGMTTCKTVKAPVDTNGKISGTEGPSYSDPTEIRSLAGTLQYLMFTRPDISYAVQQICLHMCDNPEIFDQI
ncbi:uncharacterized protein [Rutidosis leptorrhynchoides]|uniref:uncharacterized protein n=1 Tax=Rutidosis leptorrhynchoides TaxID=125765 RepID=UPI003A9935B4